MAITSSTSSAANLLHFANGSHLDSGGSPADASIKLGFIPRFVQVVNETDRITFEWYEGIASEAGVKTAANGDRTLETSGLIGVSGDTITFPVIQNKQYRWISLG